MTNEYAKKVAERITGITGWRCVVNEISNNNDVSMTGILIFKDESPVAATVHVPDSIAGLTWDDLTENDIEDAAREFIETVNNNSEQPSSEIISNIVTDKQEILKRVFFCLVNRIWNTNTDLVSRSVDGDLQYIYKIDVSDIFGQSGMITITPDYLVMTGLTEDELYDAALKNTQERYPVIIKEMSEILSGFLGDDASTGEMSIYVVSNNTGVYGATAITYPGVAEELRNLLGDFYVLPSSVHECIAVKAMNDNTKELCEMVRTVNKDVVDPQEWLADHIYKFDDDGKLVSINE